jgi:hypothetical protein
MKSRKPSEPCTNLAVTPAPEPCETGLAVARAEFAALGDMSEQTVMSLLDGLAPIRTMTMRDRLIAIRVAKAQLGALETLTLQQMVLE